MRSMSSIGGPRKEMPASPWEIEAAEHEGIQFQYLVAPVEVVGENGRMKGLTCLRMQLENRTPAVDAGRCPSKARIFVEAER